MRLVAAKCPSCGADIEVDKDSDSTKCEFCQSRIMVEDALKVEVSVTNMPQYENYVTLGDKYYNEFLFREARTEYKKALEFDPTDTKLLFREKICRACMATFQKTDEDLIDEAFTEVNQKIEDYQELRPYIRESLLANAYMTNKIVDYYKEKGLDLSDMLDLRLKISMISINIDYIRKNIAASDTELRLLGVDYYLSTLYILLQNFEYKVSGTRTKEKYYVTQSDIEQYNPKRIEAENERATLISNDPELASKSTLQIPDNIQTQYIPKQTSNYSSSSVAEKIIAKSSRRSMSGIQIYFIVLYVLDLIASIVFLCTKAPYGFAVCCGNFIVQSKCIKSIKYDRSLNNTYNVICTLLFILGMYIGIKSLI